MLVYSLHTYVWEPKPKVNEEKIALIILFGAYQKFVTLHTRMGVPKWGRGGSRGIEGERIDLVETDWESSWS